MKPHLMAELLITHLAVAYEIFIIFFCFLYDCVRFLVFVHEVLLCSIHHESEPVKKVCAEFVLYSFTHSIQRIFIVCKPVKFKHVVCFRIAIWKERVVMVILMDRVGNMMHFVIWLYIFIHFVNMIGKQGDDNGMLYVFVSFGVSNLTVEHCIVIEHHSVPKSR